MPSPFDTWSESKKQKHFELCRRGHLVQLLTKAQRRVWQALKDGHKEVIWVSSRKIGKTFSDIVIAYEYCLNNPGHIVRIIAPQKNHCRDIILPITTEMKNVLPPECWPRVKTSVLEICFPNGAMIKLGGMDKDTIDANRGPISHMLIFDEVGFSDESIYDYGMTSIFFPQVANTQGPRIYTTTMPRNVAHPFILETMPRVVARGAVINTTIYDNELITPEQIEEIIINCGGKDSVNFRREYLTELIPDSSISVVPEFSNDKHVVEEIPVCEEIAFEEDKKYISYTSADLGTVDYTGILSGYLDHDLQKLVICSEKWFDGSVQGFGIEYIAKKISESQEDLTEYVRVFENNIVVDALDKIVTKELSDRYNLYFTAAKRGKVDESIALLRNCFENDKIAILKDECPNLIYQLKHGIWEENKKDFVRSKALGHLDLVMALCYLVKRVEWNRRPGQRLNFTIGAKFAKR